jgi:hypothetical protein
MLAYHLYLDGCLLQRHSLALNQTGPLPCVQSIETSAKCKSVEKVHTYLPDTLVALTSTSKYFQMLPDPPGAVQVLSDSARAFSGAPESTCMLGVPPLPVMMVVCSSLRKQYDAETNAKPVTCSLAGVQCQSQEESTIGQWQECEVRERLLSLSRNYAGHACEQARQLMVKCE